MMTCTALVLEILLWAGRHTVLHCVCVCSEAWQPVELVHGGTAAAALYYNIGLEASCQSDCTVTPGVKRESGVPGVLAGYYRGLNN